MHELRAKYEAKENFKYDFYLTTRPDLLFISDLKIKFYLDLYQNNEELKHIKLPDKFMFCATIPFRLGVMDTRYCNEADLLFWSNCGKIIHPIRNTIGINIFMDYLYGKHFQIIREKDNVHDENFESELCQEVGKVFLKRYNRRYKGGLFTFFFKDLSKILKTNSNK